MKTNTSLKVHAHGHPDRPVVLFLHAFPFTAEMWRDQLNLFSEKYYCLAPDLPGFGESAPADHPVTFEYYVDEVLNLLKERGIEKSVWCGLSMGGYLALRMYERAPGLCRALVLCDTKAGADNNEAKVKRWGAIQSLLKNRSEFVAAQWKALVGESSQSNLLLKKRFEELMAQVSDQGIAAGLVAMATRTDSSLNLSQVKVPSLIMVGEQDKVTPPPETQGIAMAIHGSEVQVVLKAGHLANLEKPNEFNEYLGAFLASLK